MPAASSKDPRVRRTRKYLQQAILALLERQDLASITVTQVSREAEINRATFYLHFRDITDLVNQTMDALFDDLVDDERLSANPDLPFVPDVAPESLVTLFRHVGEHPLLYRSLFTIRGENSFIERLDHFHEEQFIQHWHHLNPPVNEGDPPPSYRARFAAVAIHGALTWWLEQGQDQTAETVASWVWQRIGPVWFSQ